ncbi:MAG: hypothetical protein HC915_07080 [Anaerolineae bacterium]|nr:hypothetical protein [Anaerolineae bacterium]
MRLAVPADADHHHLHLDQQLAVAQHPLRQVDRRAAELDPLELAAGIVAVANANIERALRRVSVARGYDPRTFTLTAFGGAGPLHACEVAERLLIPRVLVPRYPGVMCALGLLMADVVRDLSQTLLGRAAPPEALLAEMQAAATAELTREGIPVADQRFLASVDMRYTGQSYELNIPYSPTLEDDFHAAHHQRYGYARRGHLVEAVTLRLRAIGQVAKPALPRFQVAEQPAVGPLATRSLVFRQGGHRVPAEVHFYDRATLPPGTRLQQPAVLFQLDSTTLIPPGWAAEVDPFGNLILEKIG